MKKIALLFVFFSLALCCYAQEGLNTGGNNENKPFYSGLSLPLFGIGNGFLNGTTLFGNPIMKTSFSNNSMAWKLANFRITKYADYTNENFFDTDVGPWILCILGVASLVSGPIMMATAGGGDSSGLFTGGVIVFSLGFGFITGEILWLILR